MPRDVLEITDAETTCLIEENYEDSFTLRAAQVVGIQGLHVAHEPGSRGDFLQALQQLGAETNIHQLQRSRGAGRMVRVHVSCSRHDWVEIFSEPECGEEIVISSARHHQHRWKHLCSDGSVSCVGHLFERSPGEDWVVVMRITFL